MSTSLKHGIFLAPYHPIEEGPTTWLRRDIDMCRLWEDLGLDEVWVGEHHSGGYEMIASPEIFIAAAAEATKRIRFGTGVMTLPYHNPLMSANRIAQLDHQTMGRVSFGVGPGLLVMDAMMLGVPVDKTRDRTVEALDIILRLLRGEEVTQKSEWYNLVNARAHLLPYTQPLPEFAVASAGTPSGGVLAGKFGISMLCVAASQIGAFDVLDRNWQIACETAAQHGHTMDPNKLRLVAPVHIAETREKARENVRHSIERWARYYEMISANPFHGKGDIIDILIDSGRAVIGTPDDAIAMIEKLRNKQGRFGVFLNQHKEWADWEQTRKSYEMYARYVMPHFSNANQNRRKSFEKLSERNEELLDIRHDAAQKAHDKYAAATGQKAEALPSLHAPEKRQG